MSREKRLELIRHIQEIRNSHVLVYITSDRQGAGASINPDVIRPLYDHLQSFVDLSPEKRKVDLYIYSVGGDVSVPWRIVTMIREFCDEFCVLIPYKAYSATTMISLGADRIVMGKKAELGPIDPSLIQSAIGEAAMPPKQISVEDVFSYLSFMREKANISDQMALSQIVSQLAEHLTPVTLGTVNRQYSHIRLVARKLLACHQEKIEESRIATIIDTLTEKMYSHGHAIGRKEASDIGLPVEKPDTNVEKLIWDLYQEYEDLLQINNPFDPQALLAQRNQEQIDSKLPFGVVESVHKLDIYQSVVRVQRRRQAAPQMTINLNLALPPGCDPNQLTPQAQQQLQQILTQVAQVATQTAQQQVIQQSPIIGIEAMSYGGKWEEQKDVMV